MKEIIRSLGLHHPNQTPCGQPISISEAHTIMEIQLKEEVTQSDLTQILNLEKSTVSRLVQQLEKKDWLKRETSPKDQRMKILRLTEKGQKIAQRLETSRIEKFNSILANIPENRHKEVIVALELLIEAIPPRKD
ncbi:winged helix DNA-binding protein [Bacillus shivajii]|uniref:MarR family winged helix-turn-helix transcriptional regulator n=1 Tax=Bacillus shivajii TaxID=1983719 RepID=UPI001CFBB2EB|nr:MarR family transcriptional regulator [Bacillus shivajii]UCZ53760.1 winged helix DNA-binding protein [Bacillus shivajii]